MRSEKLHPNSATPLAEPAGDAAVWRRLVERGLLLLLLLGSLAMGAGVDFGLRGLGLRWPPVFTAIWGAGGLLVVGAAWIRLEPRRREDEPRERR